MTDAMEAVRQAVKQKAANELVGAHAHLLLGVAMPVVAPTEAEGSILDAEKAADGEQSICTAAMAHTPVSLVTIGLLMNG